MKTPEWICIMHILFAPIFENLEYFYVSFFLRLFSLFRTLYCKIFSLLIGHITFLEFELEKLWRQFRKSRFNFSRSGRVSLRILAVNGRFRRSHIVIGTKSYVTFLIFELQNFKDSFGNLISNFGVLSEFCERYLQFSAVPHH